MLEDVGAADVPEGQEEVPDAMRVAIKLKLCIASLVFYPLVLLPSDIVLLFCLGPTALP